MNDVAHKVKVETEAAKAVLMAVAHAIGDDEDKKEIVIDGETNLNEAMRAGVLRLKELEEMGIGLKSVIDMLESRQRRFKEQHAKIKASILSALTETGRKRIELDIATVSLSKSPPKVIPTDESEIPARFWRQADPEIDKKAIAKALKAGEEVPGATLGNAPATVSIKMT